MRHVIITGSTRGIGFALADAFLALGCRVTVSGRTPGAVKQAVATLAARHDADRVFGHPCDVTDFAEVRSLWDEAKAHAGRVDIWINNAGITHPATPVVTQTPDAIRAVVETNLIGLINGSRVAVEEMIRQGFGQIYNMEGYGSRGSVRREMRLTIYATTKAAVRYFSLALAREVDDTPVQVGTISPGMVVTDMLLKTDMERPEERERALRAFNILADRAETVAPWIAREVLKNSRNGASIRWLTPAKVMMRFVLAPFVRRDVVGPPQPPPTG